MSTTATRPVELAAAEVTVTRDRFGREVIVIPDAAARALYGCPSR
jgi:hypothetical protein